MLAISKIETSSCSYRDNLFSIIQSQVIVQLKLKITPTPPPNHHHPLSLTGDQDFGYQICLNQPNSIFPTS